MPDDPRKCDALDFEGKLEVQEGAFIVGSGGFSAYVDKAGKLHFCLGGFVGRVDSDKQGTIRLYNLEELKVGKKCSLTDPLKKTTNDVPCRFEEKDGATLFIYTAAVRSDWSKTKEYGLVYLANEKLLVSPILAAISFDKQ